MKSSIRNILLLMAFGTLSACSEQTVTVSYQEYPNAFRNPMKGFREFFAPGIDRVREEYPYPYGSLTKEYMQWNMIEDDANDGVDKIIAYSNHRWKGVEDINVKVIPRVFLVWLEPWHGGKPKDPTNPDDLTGWHWPKGIDPEKGPYKQKPNSVGAYVEEKDKNTPISGGYFDPSFPERVKKLVEKLGQAWDNDPRVAYVEMGIIGEWGEHHDPDLSTYWAPHDEPEHVANRTWIPGMEKILGDAFAKAFKNKKVMVRYAYEFKDYEFGIYWDSWSQPQEIVRGYEEMKKLPGALFIVDTRKERNAIAEAHKLGIPVVAIADTNCDPDEIDYVIPGNDDAIRAIKLIASVMANAMLEGKQGEQLNEAAEAPAAE